MPRWKPCQPGRTPHRSRPGSRRPRASSAGHPDAASVLAPAGPRRPRPGPGVPALRPQVGQNLVDDRWLLDERQDARLATAAWADQRVHLVHQADALPGPPRGAAAWGEARPSAAWRRRGRPAPGASAGPCRAEGPDEAKAPGRAVVFAVGQGGSRKAVRGFGDERACRDDIAEFRHRQRRIPRMLRRAAQARVCERGREAAMLWEIAIAMFATFSCHLSRSAHGPGSRETRRSNDHSRTSPGRGGRWSSGPHSRPSASSSTAWPRRWAGTWARRQRALPGVGSGTGRRLAH
jgi:hypothetical protein